MKKPIALFTDDVVYMEHNDKLDLDPAEYVLKENGNIWRGSHDRSMPWNFGQVILNREGRTPLRCRARQGKF